MVAKEEASPNSASVEVLVEAMKEARWHRQLLIDQVLLEAMLSSSLLLRDYKSSSACGSRTCKEHGTDEVAKRLESHCRRQIGVAVEGKFYVW